MKVNEVRGIHAKFILNQLDAVCNSNLRLNDLAARRAISFDRLVPKAPVSLRKITQGGLDDDARRIVSGVIFSPGAPSISFPRLCHRVQPCRVWLGLWHQWMLLRIVLAWL